jgi:hypothetical protein
MPNQNIIVVEVPLTLSVSVLVPEGAGDAAREAARALAQHAAHTFSHVSHASIRAFNETNRLHPQGAGMVTAVEARFAAG